jgi:dimethylaniline monooxygenase (N-oxide forming)
MLKQLLEDGFDVTLFERRDKVGGLWAYDADHGWTTALKGDSHFSPSAAKSADGNAK